MSPSRPPVLADPQSTAGRAAADEELASRLQRIRRLNNVVLTRRLAALDPAERPLADGALTGLLEHPVTDG
jgi:hypothetical protein